MNDSTEIVDSFIVGGSMPANATTYVSRAADAQIYELLNAQKFCYVLTSRQMGKSSLRVRTMHRLRKEGTACGYIDLSPFGEGLIVTPADASSADRSTLEIQRESLQRWYNRLIGGLASSLGLKKAINIVEWRNDHRGLEPGEQLQIFVEDVVLTRITGNIVIFIDELDSILKNNFSNDAFFKFVRWCYNARADDSRYNRLTFAVIGCASPDELIQDKRHTPFNIGHRIELEGFTLDETKPLQKALGVTANYDTKETLAAILAWTGGQPFLTHKLCEKISHEAQLPEKGGEKKFIDNIVAKKILADWEKNDSPQHLQTIRDRMVTKVNSDSNNISRCLVRYQKILEGKQVPAENSDEEMELRLCGLVKRCGPYIEPYCKIYSTIFNLEWAEELLLRIRPYNQGLNAWIASDKTDNSRLLRKKALREAHKWARGQRLHEDDLDYLNASDDQENRVKRRMTFIVGICIILAFISSASVLYYQKDNQALRAEKADLQSKQAKRESAIAKERNAEAQWYLSQMLAEKAENAFTSALSGDHPQEQFERAWLYSLRAAETVLENRQALTRQKDIVLEADERQIWSQVLTILSSHKLRNIIGQPQWCSPAIGDGIEGSTQNVRLRVNSVVFSSDGQWLVYGGDENVVNLLNVKRAQAILPLNLKTDTEVELESDPYSVVINNVNDVSISYIEKDERFLVSGASDKRIGLWEVTVSETESKSNHSSLSLKHKEIKLKECEQNSDKSASGAKAIALNPDGETLASGHSDGSIRIWSVQTGDCLHLVKSPLSTDSHVEAVTSIAFSPDGKTLASGSEDYSVKLWSINSNGSLILLETLRGHRNSVSDVAFNYKGNILASTSWDGVVRIWDVNEKEATKLRNDFAVTDRNDIHESFLSSLSFSKDGKWLAVGAWDSNVYLFNGDDAVDWVNEDSPIEPLLRLNLKNSPVYSVAFAPDNTLASGAEMDLLHLWRLGSWDGFTVDKQKIKKTISTMLESSEEQLPFCWNKAKTNLNPRKKNRRCDPSQRNADVHESKSDITSKCRPPGTDFVDWVMAARTGYE